MITACCKDNKGCVLQKQAEAIGLLQTETKHKIKVISEFTDWEGGQFTCFQFALGLSEDRELIDFKNKNPVYDAGFDSCFVNYLITNGLLTQNNNGSLVIYFFDGWPKHAARFVGSGRAISKWGLGNVYEHELYEVPESYGDDTKTYLFPDLEIIKQKFYWYCNNCLSI